MKKVLFLILVLVFVSAGFSQDTQKPFDLSNYGVRIEPDKRLIAVMAALEFAGLETPLSKNGQEFRLKLREDIKEGVNETLQGKMKAFIASYKSRHPQATPAQLAAPFVSLAYTLSPAPELNEPPRAGDLPDD